MSTYLSICESHLQRLLSATADLAGEMWPSALDVRTCRYPEGVQPPRRVYRLIGAPHGSTLYWDQPMIVAAYELSRLTKQPQYALAADAYVADFLTRCISENGLFEWGNHQYYDLFEQKMVGFAGGHHELRPITPAWDVFWRHALDKTALYIRTMAQRHLYDPVSGGFNRHDDGKKEHAFLEAGGILGESLAWLYGKTGDAQDRETALQIARYSYRHANPSTGLVPNEPDKGRWDAKVCTTEIGLWAQCLLRAASYTGSDEFVQMASKALQAFLNYAYDSQSGGYFGQVEIATGKPVVADQPGYWPRQYSDAWNTDQWPTHDYPMALAEACLTLFSATGQTIYLDAVRRWACLAVDNRPGKTGGWAYAENYGRCIHFLVRAGLLLDDHSYLAGARQLAEEALACLGENGLLKGYPGGHVYEAVDGVGFLLLALIFLETQGPLNLHGFGF